MNIGFTDYLIKSQTSVKSSSFQEKEEIICYTCMITNHEWRLVSISKNGAIHSHKKVEESGGTRLFPDKTLAYLCSYCRRICRDSQKVREHITNQHSGPVKCDKCDSYQEDLHELSKHKKSCSFACGVIGCQIVHLTKISANKHKMKYLKANK